MDLEIHTASDQKSDAGTAQIPEGASGPDLMVRIQGGETFHSAGTTNVADAKDLNLRQYPFS